MLCVRLCVGAEWECVLITMLYAIAPLPIVFRTINVCAHYIACKIQRIHTGTCHRHMNVCSNTYMSEFVSQCEWSAVQCSVNMCVITLYVTGRGVLTDTDSVYHGEWSCGEKHGNQNTLPRNTYTHTHITHNIFLLSLITTAILCALASLTLYV